MTSSLRSNEPCRYSRAVKGSAHWLDDHHAGERTYDPAKEGWNMLKTTFTLDDHPLPRHQTKQRTEAREAAERTLAEKNKDLKVKQKHLNHHQRKQAMGTHRTLSSDRIAVAAQTLRSSSSFASTMTSSPSNAPTWPHVRGVSSSSSRSQLSAASSSVDMGTSYWTKRHGTATVQDAEPLNKCFHRTGSSITESMSATSIHSSKSSSTFADD